MADLLRQEVAPFYRKAERLMAVYGSRDGLSNLPDGNFKTCGATLRRAIGSKGGVETKKRGRAMEFVGQRKAMPTEACPGNAPPATTAATA